MAKKPSPEVKWYDKVVPGVVTKREVYAVYLPRLLGDYKNLPATYTTLSELVARITNLFKSTQETVYINNLFNDEKRYLLQVDDNLLLVAIHEYQLGVQVMDFEGIR